MNLGLCNGSTLVIVNGFKPEQFLGLIEQHRITTASLVPPIILFLAGHPLVDDFDMSSLKYIMSGAAPVGEAQLLAVGEHILCPVHQGYGLTETSPVALKEPDLLARTKPGTVGVLTY
ncbi:protein containing AMP-dependent synthetase and ligase domain, partial [methanotrophic bacterial endosymbiont of Bathymodiolus sp.]